MIKRNYDDKVYAGFTKALKLAEHWKALQTELDQASASLSQAVGLAVRLMIFESSDDDASSADQETLRTHPTAKLCHLIRLSCPDLKYDSGPLAYMRSCPEGLPFVFWYGDAFRNRVTSSDERKLQSDLQSFVGHLLSTVQTGVLVRDLAERAKRQTNQLENMEKQPVAQTLGTVLTPTDSPLENQDPLGTEDSTCR